MEDNITNCSELRHILSLLVLELRAVGCVFETSTLAEVSSNETGLRLILVLLTQLIKRYITYVLALRVSRMTTMSINDISHTFQESIQ